MKNNTNKSLLTRLFYNNKFLLVFCALVSVIVWAAVKINYSADTVRTISDMKVTLTENTENPDFVAFVDSADLTVEVEIKGKAYNINAKALSKDDIIIEASTGFVDSAGYKNIALTARVAETAASEDFEITKITPSTIAVFYDRKVTDTFNVVARVDKELDGLVKKGFSAGKPVPSLNTVDVTGPATVLNELENVYFEADIDESKLPLEATLELPAQISYPVSRSAYSKFLECASIDSETNPATVTLPVYATKTVPATVKFINQPEGMKVPDYEIWPSEVEIIYNPNDEEKYSEFPAGTIDFRNLDNSENRIILDIDHEKTPVKLTDKETTEFEVYVDLSEYSKTTISYTVSNVIFLNKQDGMVYSVEQGQGLDEITVIGPEASIEKLTSDDINIEINVSALNVSRSNGETLDVNISVGNTEITDCWVYGEYKAYVVAMTQQEAEAAAATTESSDT